MDKHSYTSILISKRPGYLNVYLWCIWEAALPLAKFYFMWINVLQIGKSLYYQFYYHQHYSCMSQFSSGVVLYTADTVYKLYKINSRWILKLNVKCWKFRHLLFTMTPKTRICLSSPFPMLCTEAAPGNCKDNAGPCRIMQVTGDSASCHWFQPSPRENIQHQI